MMGCQVFYLKVYRSLYSIKGYNFYGLLRNILVDISYYTFIKSCTMATYEYRFRYERTKRIN